MKKRFKRGLFLVMAFIVASAIMLPSGAMAADTLDIGFTKQWCISGINTRETHLAMDGIEVDDVAKMVWVEGNRVDLTPTEYKILRLLMEKPGRVLSNSQIYESIWKMAPIGADNTVAVHIRHIREKIEENPQNPRYLRVVWGQGYKVG